MSRVGLSGLATLVALAMLGPTTPTHAETVTYTYDALGRLVSAATTGGHTATYTYDANGNRTQVVVAGGTNTAPSAVADSKTTAYNTALSFDPRTNDSDPNGDAMTISAKTNGSHGTVAITGGGTGLTYTPTTGYSGADTFTYTISDGALTSVATVTMTVSSANSPPVANDDFVDANAYYTGGGSGSFPTAVFDPRTNDTDANSNPITIISVTQPMSGTVTFTGATLTYTYGTRQYPTGMDATPIDSDEFTYTISDGQGGTDTATVSVVVVVW